MCPRWVSSEWCESELEELDMLEDREEAEDGEGDNNESDDDDSDMSALAWASELERSSRNLDTMHRVQARFCQTWCSTTSSTKRIHLDVVGMASIEKKMPCPFDMVQFKLSWHCWGLLPNLTNAQNNSLFTTYLKGSIQSWNYSSTYYIYLLPIWHEIENKWPISSHISSQ